MSITAEKFILEALQKAAIAAVENSTMNELPIKVIGRTFAVPNDQKYLELVHIPNNIDGQFWNAEKTHRGIFRLVLHWPVDDRGAYAPIAVLASIASYFNKDMRLQAGDVTVKIIENPDFLGMVEAGHETIYPVSMRYQCFRII